MLVIKQSGSGRATAGGEDETAGKKKTRFKPFCCSLILFF
jgi:hypothetical protein